MKVQVEVCGWGVVDSANWPGASAKGGVIAKIGAVYGTKAEAEAHLTMLRSMPAFLHKDWIIVHVGMTFFEVEGESGEEGGDA